MCNVARPQLLSVGWAKRVVTSRQHCDESLRVVTSRQLFLGPNPLSSCELLTIITSGKETSTSGKINEQTSAETSRQCLYTTRVYLCILDMDDQVLAIRMTFSFSYEEHILATVCQRKQPWKSPRNAVAIKINFLHQGKRIGYFCPKVKPLKPIGLTRCTPAFELPNNSTVPVYTRCCKGTLYQPRTRLNDPGDFSMYNILVISPLLFYLQQFRHLTFVSLCYSAIRYSETITTFHSTYYLELLCIRRVVDSIYQYISVCTRMLVVCTRMFLLLLVCYPYVTRSTYVVFQSRSHIGFNFPCFKQKLHISCVDRWY